MNDRQDGVKVLRLVSNDLKEQSIRAEETDVNGEDLNCFVDCFEKDADENADAAVTFLRVVAAKSELLPVPLAVPLRSIILALVPPDRGAITRQNWPMTSTDADAILS